MPRKTSTLSLIAFIIGILIFLYGVTIIAASVGALIPLEIYSVRTPIGEVSTDNPQVGGGMIIAILGLLLVYISRRL
jgi:divalent metal cation (Fe/Co/Zn/Cd) transporter